MRVLFVLAFAFGLTGCGYYFSERPPIMERRVITGSEKNGIVATSADYRLVIFNSNGQFCSEASPDAISQLAQNFGAKLAAGKAEATASLDAQLKFATKVLQLTRRSQGLQLFRDGAFQICNLALNGSIAPDQVPAQMNALRDASYKLIAAEIEKFGPLAVNTPSDTTVPDVTIAAPVPATSAGRSAAPALR